MATNKYDIEKTLLDFLGISIVGCSKAVITLAADQDITVEATYEVFKPLAGGMTLDHDIKKFRIEAVEIKESDDLLDHGQF